jgi:hypothetical protein
MGKGRGIYHFLGGPFPSRSPTSLPSKLELEPPVTSNSSENVWPASLQSRRSCYLAWRVTFAFVAASLFASRSNTSMESRSALAFLRWKRHASISTVVRERRKTDTRNAAP